MPGKSPSVWRVGVIAGAFAVLACAVTPAVAAPHRTKETVKKPARTTTQPARPSKEGSGGSLSLEWTISATLRP
jgi:hypothetical protein